MRFGDMMKWVGCSECDPAFPCYNGAERCFRMPEKIEAKLKALLPRQVLADEFNRDITDYFWNKDRSIMSTRVFQYWAGKFQPIEESL